MGYFNVRFHDKTWENGDTIIYTRESGSFYPMTIDQLNNRIYNVDSLAYGSDVKGVTTSVNGVGTMFYSYSDDSGKYYLWSVYDSVDFTRPVVFTALSSDGSYKRDYTVQLNIRKVFPDSLHWSQADSVGFTALDNPCAAILNDSIYNFGLDGNGVLSMESRSIYAGPWSAPVAVSGIPAAGWSRNVVVCGGKIYAQSGTSVYVSADGKNWAESRNGIKSLIRNATDGGTVWAVATDSSILKTSDMSEWTVLGKAPAGFADSAAVTVEYPLVTNVSIKRTILVGPGSDSLYASVWTINSVDSEWTHMDAPVDESLRLPVMPDLTMIRYDYNLFVFGAGVSDFRQSSDNGITWYRCDTYAEEISSWNRYMQIPDALEGFNGTISSAVDSLGTIWIMTSDGQVWRGAITRLDKR